MNFIEKVEFSKFTKMKETIPCEHLAWIHNFHSNTKEMKIIFYIKHLIHLCLEIQNQFITPYRCNYSEDSCPNSYDKKCILEKKSSYSSELKKNNNHKIFKTGQPDCFLIMFLVQRMLS